MTYAQYGNSAYPYNWASSDDYYMYDQFTTDRAAGAINGTSAEPVGGTRTVVDTNNKISISGGLLSLATGSVANDYIAWPIQTRVLGKAFIATITPSVASVSIGFDRVQGGALNDAIVFSTTNNIICAQNGNVTNKVVGTWVAGTEYQVAVILRTTGAFYFIRGGTFTNWTFLNLFSVSIDSAYPTVSFVSNTGVATVTNARVPVDVYVPVPLQSDGFSGTTTDGLGNQENNGPAGTAYTAVGTWGVSGGSLSCSALSGGLGFRYLDGVSADVILDLNVTRSGGNAGIVARYVDANNYLIAYHTGTNGVLAQVVAGVTTVLVNAAATYSAGATLRLFLDGTSGRLMYNNSTVGSAVTVPSSTSTNHGIYTTNTGNTFDNFAVWARGNSSTYYSGLDALDNHRYYGVGTFDNSQWGIDIDWDNDGTYNGDNEAIYAIALRTSRGRTSYLNIDASGNASGFEPVRVGTATLVLDNTSRRYDPYNTSSDLYPNVQAGRYIRIRTAYNGVVYDVIHGKIRSITPEDMDGTSRVTLEIEDGLRLLQNTDASVAIQQNVRIDQAITQVLDDVGYPAIFGTNIETSDDVMGYWWATNRAANEIRDLAQAELGQFFIAADGAATFYSRRHTSGTVDSLTSSDFLKNIDVPMPAEVLRNYVKMYARPRTLQTAGVLWTLQDTPLISAGGSLTVWATYQYNTQNCPALNVSAPVAMTDYTMNTVSDGSGTNLTGDFTVTLTDFGTTAKLVITNNGASAGYITLMQVQGQAITALNPSLLIEEDTASQAVYGKALLTIDNDWLQDTAQASDFANWLISYLVNPQKFITVRIDARPDIQFTYDLFDAIDVTITRLGITNVIYRISSIEHQWLTDNGQAVRTTWVLEPNPDLSGYWQFTTTIGVTTIFGI